MTDLVWGVMQEYLIFFCFKAVYGLCSESPWLQEHLTKEIRSVFFLSCADSVNNRVAGVTTCSFPVVLV